jgi:hypothetical protein
MKEAGATFVANAKLPDFELFDIHGGFPYMRRQKGVEAWGEMWDFDKFEDIYGIVAMELGVGYDVISIETTNGDMIYAFIYDLQEGERIVRKLDGEQWAPIKTTYEQRWEEIGYD